MIYENIDKNGKIFSKIIDHFGFTTAVDELWKKMWITLIRSQFLAMRWAGWRQHHTKDNPKHDHHT